MQRYVVSKALVAKTAVPLCQVGCQGVRTPMIKFIGKRDLVAAGAAAAAAATPASPKPAGSTKPLSPNCELAFDTDHDAYARRIVISQEECDIINAGG